MNDILFYFSVFILALSHYLLSCKLQRCLNEIDLKFQILRSDILRLKDDDNDRNAGSEGE